MTTALLLRLARQEFTDRYAGSVLGIIWAIAHPLLLVAVFFMVFAQLMGGRLPGIDDVQGYGVYLIAGLLPWIAFSGVVARTTQIFQQRRDVLGKVRLPLLVPPLCVLIGETISFLIAMAVFALALAITGYPVAVAALLVLPLVYLAQQALAFGIGLLLGILNVFVRDIQEFVSVLLLVWFWGTPIVWVLDIVPPAVATAQIAINPVYWFVQAWQSVIALGEAPDTGLLLRLAGVAVIACAAALWLLHRRERVIRDHL